MDQRKKDRLARLLDLRQEIVRSRRNQTNRRWWRDSVPWCRDMWRRIPRGNLKEGVPFVVAPDNSIWFHVFDMDLRQYYFDAYTHLEKQLEIDIYKFEQFNDDTYLDDHLFIWFGVITELTFFGIKPVFFESREGWIEEPPLLENPQDLETLEPPDFLKSGLMPRIHQFYEEMSELVQGRCTIMFPDWARGPFCMAAHLRGLQNLLMDMITEPEFVHQLMRFVTDARKEWCSQRSKFLNVPIQKGKLYNDEVDCPTLSPHMYREFILPYEQELSEFHGGIAYWHSCGNTTVFMEDIRKLLQLEMFHVSPWGDLSKSVSVMSPEVVLDVNLDPLADVLQCDVERMEVRLREIAATCGDVPYCVRADAFQVVHGLQRDLDKIKLWAQAARRVLHK
jgi:uroporphyrinogen-III decarboxylase